jgi:hypothetical protein
MASNHRFMLLVFGVSLDEVRSALANNTAKSQLAPQRAAASDTLIDFADYSILPHTFMRADLHPTRTNLLCWHCSLPFTCVPRFIALESARVAPSEPCGAETYEWTIDGNFCSWACAGAYISANYKDPKKWALMQNLAVARAQADGVKIRPVRCAPSRTKMRLYCGTSGMSQSEYASTVEALSAP